MYDFLGSLLGGAKHILVLEASVFTLFFNLIYFLDLYKFFWLMEYVCEFGMKLVSGQLVTCLFPPLMKVMAFCVLANVQHKKHRLCTSSGQLDTYLSFSNQLDILLKLKAKVSA